LKTTMEKNYEGWFVQVKCSAADDEAGRKSTFDACAEARLLDPQYFENGWIEVDPLTVPDQGMERFSDCSAANTVLWERVTSAIDALKKFG
jgi:hypothetical protein